MCVHVIVMVNVFVCVTQTRTQVYMLAYKLERCSVLQCVAVSCSVLQCAAVCCSVLQCAAVCYSVLQCVAVCCIVL